MKLLEDKDRKIADETASLTNQELHLRLQEVDPKSAAALHPNNRRKVLR